MEDSESQLERYLRLLTDEQRAVICAHEVSFCTLDGRFVPFAPQPAVNLFETISKMERYVVDSHGNWKAEAAKPENRDRAFILGRTILEEQHDTRGLLFGPKVNLCNNNIFLLGMRSQLGEGPPWVKLERLDEAYRKEFDEERLSNAAKGLKDTKLLNYERRRLEDIGAEKDAVLSIIRVTDIASLPAPRELEGPRADLLASIRAGVSACVNNYLKAIDIARRCYALLLMEKIKIRNEFASPDYDNVFGDTTAIQNALFLKAAILSEDKQLRRMAGYVRLECVKSL